MCRASCAIRSECTVIIIEGSDGTQLGLVVDEHCGHQQVVIKSIEENYGRVPGIAAATILGNGRVAFIVDIEKISELADNDLATAAAAAAAAAHQCPSGGLRKLELGKDVHRRVRVDGLKE